MYGHDYRFYLTDAVEDVPEYLVDWENFVSYVLFFFLRLGTDDTTRPGWLPSLDFDWSTKRRSMRFSKKKKIAEISARSWGKWEC